VLGPRDSQAAITTAEGAKQSPFAAPKAMPRPGTHRSGSGPGHQSGAGGASRAQNDAAAYLIASHTRDLQEMTSGKETKCLCPIRSHRRHGAIGSMRILFDRNLRKTPPEPKA